MPYENSFFPTLKILRARVRGRWASKQMLGNHGAECKAVDFIIIIIIIIISPFFLDCHLSWQHWSTLCSKSEVFGLRRWTRIFQAKDNNRADICNVFPKQVKSSDWFSQYSVPGLLIIIIEQQSKIQGSCLWPSPRTRSIKCYSNST